MSPLFLIALTSIFVVLFAIAMIFYKRSHVDTSKPHIASELFAVVCTGTHVLGDAQLADGYRYAKSSEVSDALSQGMRIHDVDNGFYALYSSPDPISNSKFPNVYITSEGDFDKNVDINLPAKSAKTDDGHHTFIAFVVGIKPIKSLNDERFTVLRNSNEHNDVMDVQNKYILTPQKTIPWNYTSWFSTSPIELFENLDDNEMFIIEMPRDKKVTKESVIGQLMSVGYNMATPIQMKYSVAHGLSQGSINRVVMLNDGNKTGVCGLKPCNIGLPDCGSGVCGKISLTKDSKYVCCPSGERFEYEGQFYCSDMPDGAKCVANDWCKSGKCSSYFDSSGKFHTGICGESKPSPNPKKPTYCDDANGCSNGLNACGFDTAEKDPHKRKICCPSGQTVSYGSFPYCTDMKDGTVCWKDDMCGSGYCKGNVGGLERGICSKREDFEVEKKEMLNGYSCWSNTMCETGYCDGSDTPSYIVPLYQTLWGSSLDSGSSDTMYVGVWGIKSSFPSSLRKIPVTVFDFNKAKKSFYD